MGLALAVSNATVTSWLKDNLTLANIRTSGGSTIKAATFFAASHGASMRTIMEDGDQAYTSSIYGHYNRCLPREVLVRILEETSANIQGVHVARIVADNPH